MIDINTFKFEESWENEIGETSIYFITPKDLIENTDKTLDIEHTEVMIDLQVDETEIAISVYVAFTVYDRENEIYNDVDWRPYKELTHEQIIKLCKMAGYDLQEKIDDGVAVVYY